MNKSLSWLTKIPRPVAVVAGLCLVAGLATIIGFNGGLFSADTGPGEIVTTTTENPSEQMIASDYKVHPNDPLSIEIPSRGIKGYTQKVGVDQHEAVAAPNNVNLAGWFVNSVRPGEKGLSVIDGHVSGRSQPGVFKVLDSVKTGDVIRVEFGNGKVKTFEVFETKKVPEAQTVERLFDQSPDVSSQLNIVTCAGRYDAANHRYADRVIVSASLNTD